MTREIEVDDDLMRSAMKALGSADARATVERALEILIERRRTHEELMSLKGRVEWDDDLDAMRRDK